MFKKYLINLILIASVFAVTFNTVTLAELEEHHGPKFVVFGDSSEEMTTNLFGNLEKVSETFADKFSVELFTVDRSVSDEEIFQHEAFSQLPILFIQLPSENFPARFTGEINYDGIVKYIEDQLVEPDYSKVVEFTTKEDFGNLINSAKKPIFVKHFEQWCGHCKSLKPHFARAAGKTDSVIFMEVECSKDDESRAFCAGNQVQGYPTLKIFNGKDWIDYNGPRTTDALVDFANQNTDVYEYDQTVEDSKMAEEAGFVDPVPCDFIKMTISEVETDQSPKIVVFGDIRQAKTQKVYANIAEAAKKTKWEYKIARIEAYMSANAAVFSNDFFASEPRIFLVAPGSTAPVLFDGNVESVDAIISFISDSLVEPDYSKVVEFTSEEDLFTLSQKLKKPILVKHFEQWCGHCKSLKPHFARAAGRGSDVIFMEVECSKNDESRAFCEKQGIQGYPTLKIFNGKDWIDYNGPRTARDLYETAKSYAHVGEVAHAIKEEAQNVSSVVDKYMAILNENVAQVKVIVANKTAVAKEFVIKQYNEVMKLASNLMKKDL